MTTPPDSREGALTFRVLRASFRLLPLGEATRDRWRERFLHRFPALTPPLPRGAAAVGAPRRRAPVVQAGGRAIGYVEPASAPLPDPLPATVVAFHLPQFHAIPENDAWWGEGFTEWRNVVRALPQFEGHAQPKLPGELGFYDLGSADVLRNQVQLAQRHGVGAFCFYFYWFGGKRLIEQPLLDYLADASLALPFCLCWANEPWSRRWDGRGQDVLIAQAHGAEDDLAFIEHVARYLRDPRCLRVDGKPLLLVYRPALLPDANATAQRWRGWCREHDIGEIVLACVQSFERPDPRTIGFDFAVEFPPNLGNAESITARQHLLNPDYAGRVEDWRAMAAGFRDRADPGYPRWRGVCPQWDNEARRPGAGRTLLHASPRGYADWLADSIERGAREHTEPSRRLVFVNAWNEWAEGAYLEPDARLGHAWLAATRNALIRADAALNHRARPVPAPRFCVVAHVFWPELLDGTLDALAAIGIAHRLIITTVPERVDTIRAGLQARGIDAEVEAHENRGRDILPFLRVANRLLDEGLRDGRDPIVLKLHGKRSTHRADGDAWRDELFRRLLAPARAPRLLDAFGTDAALGLVAAEGHLQPLTYYWGGNEDSVRYLCRVLGIAQPDPQRGRFVAGAMFWCRLSALRPLLDAHLGEWEFEAESGQVDGTLAHAVERVIALAVLAAGARVASAASVCGEPDTADAPYPYARRR